MAKRFTDSEKWKDDWFFDLSDTHKLFWLYLLDNCDHAGFWKPTKGLVKASISQSIDFETLLNREFKDRVFLTNSGKWFIPKFLKFQYPRGLSPSVPTTKGVIIILKEEKCYERVMELFGKGFITLKDKDKDKDKDRDKDRDKKKDKSEMEEKIDMTGEPYKLTMFFKALTGYAKDDKSWDKLYLKRNMGSAKKLIEFCKTYESAKDCIRDVKEWAEDADLSWTFETVVSKAADWKTGKLKPKNSGKKELTLEDKLAIEQHERIQARRKELEQSKR